MAPITVTSLDEARAHIANARKISQTAASAMLVETRVVTDWQEVEE
ncbi:hypothetical protein [Corynebacterium qintianiae]|nr:hypothetical protein [Corynebacterium qintianiae]